MTVHILKQLSVDLFQTNTFQAVMATDEILSYCIFNYDKLMWTSATNAGGGPGDGLGGTPAFVCAVSKILFLILLSLNSNFSRR